ncbi:MAG TPA: hypothetical protein VK971_09090 [Thiohalobacter sp.]|nr:hypothetical protein [Thiohalobacter sp.]
MAEQRDIILSPTVIMVLDEYHAALHADENVSSNAAENLDALLRNGKVPKFDDIDAALSPPPEKDKP